MKRRAPIKTEFPWTLWRWTGPTESLYDLSPEELAMFRAWAEVAS